MEPTCTQEKPAGKSFFGKAVGIASFLILLYHFLYISDAFIYMGIIINPFVHVAIHIGILLSLVFLLVPAKKGAVRDVPPWYDVVLAILVLIPPFFHGFTFLDRQMAILGIISPEYVVLGWLFVLLILEAVRRTIGMVFVVVIAVFLIYPMIASHLPGILYGFSFSYKDMGNYLLQSPYAILGMPARISSIVIIAFLFFGQLLAATGAGEFFIKFSQSLLGRARGGPAKIAVVGSGLFGMISGCPVSNVMTSGVFTIPMMKRIGFRPEFAGAVEAVASNGGNFMPPIMGAVIFILVEFTGIPYITVMFAALIPALLYYLAVLLMVDFEAAKLGLKGLPKSEIPQMKEVIKSGIIFIIPLVLIVYLLVGPMFAPQKAALWTIVVVLIVTSFNKKTRLNFQGMIDACEGTIRNMMMIVAAVAAVGVLIGSLLKTGLGPALAGGLLTITGGNLWLLLPLVAFLCFIMGMAMGVLPIYMFLAIMVAPSLIGAGLPLLAVHLFIIWWGLTCFITPPVCISCYAAASISGGDGLKTGFEAMRLAAATYIVPFAFLLGPGLLLIGTPVEIILSIVTAVIGIIALSCGLQGWMLTRAGVLERILFLIGACVLILPGWTIDLIGLVLVAVAVSINLRTFKVKQKGLAL